jgi:aminopeptidase YwaD
VLVSVDLLYQPSLRLWLRQGYPAYHYIEKTVFSEIDDNHLYRLMSKGLSVGVIDPSPWDETYVIYSLERFPRAEISGDEIWQKGGTTISEVTRESVYSALRCTEDAYELERLTLPDQFWEQLLQKTVPIRSLRWDPWIQSLVDEVNTDSLTSYIQRLQDFVTREATSESSYAASQWLFNRFQQMGYPVEFDSFPTSSPHPPYGSGVERNVIATHAGGLGLSDYYIICGHFDSISEIPGYAPGADDNATGAACTIEAARVFSDQGFDHTIDFICWGAEEVATEKGSSHYAQQAVEEGWDIGGVVNFDMIGYMNDEALDCDIRTSGDVSYPLGQLFINASQTYVPSLQCYEVDGIGGDSTPFWYRGYRTLLAIEHEPSDNPYYNGSEDVIDHLSPELYTAITKAAIATMAVLGVSPCMIEDVAVRDVGDGESLELQWAASEEQDVVGYNIQWGTTSGEHTDSLFVPGMEGTTGIISDLEQDSTYYLVVRALDADDYQSWGATEIEGIPRLVPAAPEEVVATPIMHGIRIDWQPNQESDIAGYRVYRRVNENSEYDSLNIEILIDTTFTDVQLSGENKYFYAVRAVDESGNIGLLSEEAYGRPITLDQGILLVDETRNVPPGPPDSLQDDFYGYLLDGYRYTEHEYELPDQRPLFADMGPYSTVVWHADDYSSPLASTSVEDLEIYLDCGGRLWFVGWKPTANLEASTSYPKDFSSGEFVYDYLKISHVELSTVSDRFEGVVGLLDYPPVGVDPDKVPQANWEGTLRYIEAFDLTASAEAIYTIDMTNDESPFEGAVCGIHYLGSDFQIVYFGFPLYFMDQEQAREVAQKVMSDFGELPVDEEPPGGPHVTELRLLQNTPNPFSDRTSIRYHIPEKGEVELRIYDVAGRLVRSLHTGDQSEGAYAVSWDGTDNNGLHVGNAVYLCKLRHDDRTIIRKLVLIR